MLTFTVVKAVRTWAGMSSSPRRLRRLRTRLKIPGTRSRRRKEADISAISTRLLTSSLRRRLPFSKHLQDIFESKLRHHNSRESVVRFILLLENGVLPLRCVRHGTPRCFGFENGFNWPVQVRSVDALSAASFGLHHVLPRPRHPIPNRAPI